MILLFGFLFGLIFGSFLNVVIYRLPRRESLALPPSHCPACNHQLHVLDLFPVVSFLVLKGQCRYCQVKISWRYPLVEMLAAAMTVLCLWKFGLTVEMAVYLFLTYVLIAIAFIDLDHQIIPDWLTLPTILIGLTFKGMQGCLLDGLLGALAGGGLLFIILLVYPKGMGMGDVKFLAMTGVFLGWEKALYTLFLGSFLGILIIVPFILLKLRDRNAPFAFGPFLVVATLMLLYFDKIFFIWPIINS